MQRLIFFSTLTEQIYKITEALPTTCADKKQ